MRVEALLDMVGLKAVANRSVGTFSKGMARRIGLAQALINDPELLILDEPTTGLDPIGTRQIKDLILKLARRGKTILLCSHLLADVEDVCDRIAILYGGKIHTKGQVRELLQQTNKIQITADAVSDSTVKKIEQLIKDEEAECEIASPLDKLESFFIKTIAAAQQQAQPTSGAVSTTKIGAFLAEEKPVEKILDKLVSAPIEEDSSREASMTEQVVSSEKAAPDPVHDEQLLTELTGSNKTSESQPAVQEQKVDEEQLESQPSNREGEVKKDILDRLTGPSDPKEEDKQTDNS
jgi:ABC-2 type transport system ATP-binding protein